MLVTASIVYDLCLIYKGLSLILVEVDRAWTRKWKQRSLLPILVFPGRKLG